MIFATIIVFKRPPQLTGDLTMTRKLAVAIGFTAVVLALSVGSVSATATSTGVCSELPTQLQSLCTGPGVTCVKHPDAHSRWEAVLATEPTMAQAEKWATLATTRGFGSMHIEKDVHCSNGNGVYEVAQARFLKFRRRTRRRGQSAGCRLCQRALRRQLETAQLGPRRSLGSYLPMYLFRR